MITKGNDEAHAEYIADIRRGRYPTHPLVPLPSGYHDERGPIDNLLFAADLGIASVAMITSASQVIRSNHYHKTDWHFMLVVAGTMDYYWRAFPDARITQHLECRPGDLIFTPPQVPHGTYFPMPTLVLTLAHNIRRHAAHEADLVRVKLIELDEAGQVRQCK